MFPTDNATPITNETLALLSISGLGSLYEASLNAEKLTHLEDSARRNSQRVSPPQQSAAWNKMYQQKSTFASFKPAGFGTPPSFHHPSQVPASHSGFDTMGIHPFPQAGVQLWYVLHVLREEDEGRVFTVRKIQKLGFESPQKLRTHFSRFGAVKNVMVLHRQAKTENASEPVRVRPPSVGFVVMESKQVAQTILSRGVQMINGVQVDVQLFKHRDRHSHEGGSPSPQVSSPSPWVNPFGNNAGFPDPSFFPLTPTASTHRPDSSFRAHFEQGSFRPCGTPSRNAGSLPPSLSFPSSNGSGGSVEEPRRFSSPPYGSPPALDGALEGLLAILETAARSEGPQAPEGSPFSSSPPPGVHQENLVTSPERQETAATVDNDDLGKLADFSGFTDLFNKLTQK